MPVIIINPHINTAANKKPNQAGTYHQQQQSGRKMASNAKEHMWSKAPPLSSEEVATWMPLLDSFTRDRLRFGVGDVPKAPLFTTLGIMTSELQEFAKVTGQEVPPKGVCHTLFRAATSGIWRLSGNWPFVKAKKEFEHSVRGRQNNVLLHVRIVVVSENFFRNGELDFPCDQVALPKVRWLGGGKGGGRREVVRAIYQASLWGNGV